MKKLVLIAAFALTFAACSDDDSTSKRKYDTISFESSEGMLDTKFNAAELGSVTIVGYVGGTYSNVLCGKKYMTKEDASGKYFDGLLFTTADKKVGFGSYFADFGKSPYGASDVWGGFALSRNFCRTANGGQANYSGNHFSAWTEKGANGSETFAIGYINDFDPAYTYNLPKITFKEPRTVAYLYLANASLTAQYTSPKSDYYFTVIVTGYRNGVKGGNVPQTLISGKSILGDWVKVDCESLGEVDQLWFQVTSNDADNGWLNCPSYFCIDEIALVRK